MLLCSLGETGVVEGEKTLQKNTSRHVTALARVGWGGGGLSLATTYTRQIGRQKEGEESPFFWEMSLFSKTFEISGLSHCAAAASDRWKDIHVSYEVLVDIRCGREEKEKKILRGISEIRFFGF